METRAEQTLEERRESAAADLSLVKRYVEQGDTEALGELFQRHAASLFHTAARVTRNITDAEDAVQMAFVRIMKDLTKYRGGAGIRTWLTKVVIHTCQDKLRQDISRRRREQKSQEWSDMESEPSTSSGSEMESRMLRILDDLPKRYRLPVWLHFHEDMTFRDVASSLSLPEGTVRMQATRGVERIRRMLKAEGVAVTSVAIVSGLGEVSAESVPASLMSWLQDLARGAVDLSSYEGAGGGGWGGAVSWVSGRPWIAWVAALLTATTGGVALYVSTREEAPRAAARTEVAVSGRATLVRELPMPAITEAQVVRGVAFDGKYLWTHGGFNQLFKLDPETGRNLSGWKGLSVSGTHRFIVSLAWDGQYLWTMDQVGDRKVHAVDPSTGQTVRTLSLPPGTAYGSLDYGDGGLWVVVGDAEKKEGSICKLDPRTGAVLRSVPCPAGCGNATYCDGALWVTDKETIRRLSAADGRVQASFVAPGLPVGPWDACMDGAGGLWVADPFKHTLRLYSPESGGARRP